MKRYCDACRHYCDEAAMFCPTCGQYTVATEVERIAPEGDVIYPLSHYQLSYKDTYLYVMNKFMDTDGRASRREFLTISIAVACMYGWFARLFLCYNRYISNGTVFNRFRWVLNGYTMFSILASVRVVMCAPTS